MTTTQLPERYELVEHVARGGMGDVLRARDLRLDRDVAIKLLRIESTGAEPLEVRTARFEREARTIAQLDAPNVVTVFDVGETADGTPYMTMQWLPGGTMPMDRTAPLATRLRWLAQVAAALDAAHAAGVIHRDVKPSNVLLDEQGNAHVGDFGIAQLENEVGAALTGTGSIIGTAHYMSPEQAEGRGATARSDQYALAVMAFELVVGQRPFERSGAIAELAARTAEQPPVASSLDGALPRAVDPVFDRALSRHPAERFSSCIDFVTALDAALLDAAPTTRLVRPPEPIAAAPARVPARRQAPWWAIAAAVVALMGVGGALAMGDEQSPSGATEQSRSPETTTAAITDPAAPTVPAESASQKLGRSEAIALHEEAFRNLRAGDYELALRQSRQALGSLGGVSPYEAYANYNVGASLAGLGRCQEAMPYLDRSEQLQGERREINAVRQACAGDGGAGGKKDKGRDKD